jgi:hypothetical protein
MFKLAHRLTLAQCLAAQLQANQTCHRPNPALSRDTQRLAREVSQLLREALNMPTRAQNDANNPMTLQIHKEKF